LCHQWIIITNWCSLHYDISEYISQCLISHVVYNILIFNNYNIILMFNNTHGLSLELSRVVWFTVAAASSIASLMFFWPRFKSTGCCAADIKNIKADYIVLLWLTYRPADPVNCLCILSYIYCYLLWRIYCRSQ